MSTKHFCDLILVFRMWPRIAAHSRLLLRCSKNVPQSIRHLQTQANILSPPKVLCNSRREFFELRRRRSKLSPTAFAFVVGFGSVAAFSILQALHDRYKRSNQSLYEWITGKSQDNVLFEDVNADFQTKYASVLKPNEVPDLRPTKTVSGIVNLPDMKITLFQYQTCPFCCKVRAFLDYYGLSYDVVEVNPVARGELKFSKGYRKVPIIVVTTTKKGNESVLQINDSTLIISALTSYLLSMSSKSKHHKESLTAITRWYLSNNIFSHENEEKDHYTDAKFTAKQASEQLVNRYFLMIGDVDPKKYKRIDPPLAEERHWRRWVDDYFVHLISPNIYRTMRESFESFNHFSDVGEWEKCLTHIERHVVINVGAVAMYMIGKRLKKKYDLKEDVRQSLYDACNHWIRGIGKGRQFMGGDLPNLADLAMYGTLSSFEGCQAFTELMENTKLAKWYSRVKKLVKAHHGSDLIINHYYNS